jgi:hypothetical protein
VQQTAQLNKDTFQYFNRFDCPVYNVTEANKFCQDNFQFTIARLNDLLKINSAYALNVNLVVDESINVYFSKML